MGQIWFSFLTVQAIESLSVVVGETHCRIYTKMLPAVGGRSPLSTGHSGANSVITNNPTAPLIILRAPLLSPLPPPPAGGRGFFHAKIIVPPMVQAVHTFPSSLLHPFLSSLSPSLSLPPIFLLYYSLSTLILKS